MKQTVIGVFDQRTTAQQAADALAAHGIERARIHVTDNEADAAEHEGIGDRIRHFFSEVFGHDDDEHAHLHEYSEAMRRGAAVVKVQAEDEREVTEVLETLQSTGAIDIDQRVKEWRQTGWDEGTSAPTGTASLAAGAAATSAAAGLNNATADTRTAAAGQTQVLPVIEEELEVGKREINTGGIRVYTRTTSRPVEETLDLKSEHADVQRRAVDRPASEQDFAAMGDRTIEVRETAERPVVSKTARVVEEVEVGKHVEHEQQTIRDTVRTTDVDVEKIDDALGYRNHFDQNLASSGGAYEDYMPAYRYGETLRGDSRYSGQSWDQVEPNARRDWETRYPHNAWQRVKAAVRHAWERVTH